MAADASAAFIKQVTATLDVALQDSFSFNNSTLQTCPEELNKLATRLAWLDLSKNRICALPNSLSQFSLLTSLRLRANALVNIPEGIFVGLQALQDLDLVDNQLESLPADLGSAQSLERVLLTGNFLTTLPASITTLSNLRELVVAENRLTALPDDIHLLIGLEKLDAQENQLTALPSNITLCPSLQSLSLQANELTELPDKMWLLERLGALHLQDNPFNPAVIPPKLLFKRAKAILAYLLAVSEGRSTCTMIDLG